MGKHILVKWEIQRQKNAKAPPTPARILRRHERQKDTVWEKMYFFLSSLKLNQILTC